MQASRFCSQFALQSSQLAVNSATESVDLHLAAANSINSNSITNLITECLSPSDHSRTTITARIPATHTDGVIRKESSKETDDEGFQQLVAHQTSNQTIASKSSSNDEQASGKRPLVPRTATIETQLTTAGSEQPTASGPIKRFVSLDGGSSGGSSSSKPFTVSSSASPDVAAAELSRLTIDPTDSSTGSKPKASSRTSDSSTVLTVSNLIAAHEPDNMNKLIRTTAAGSQPSKASLSSLNSNASTSSESTILILQNTDLINEKAFVIQSSSQAARQREDQSEQESKSNKQEDQKTK